MVLGMKMGMGMWMPRKHFNQLRKWTKTSCTLLQNLAMVKKNVLQLQLSSCCHYCTCRTQNSFWSSVAGVTSNKCHVRDPLPFALFMWQDLMTIMSSSWNCLFKLPFFVYLCSFCSKLWLVCRLHFPQFPPILMSSSGWHKTHAQFMFKVCPHKCDKLGCVYMAFGFEPCPRPGMHSTDIFVGAIHQPVSTNKFRACLWCELSEIPSSNGLFVFKNGLILIVLNTIVFPQNVIFNA